jgi:hypothetical protein
VSGSISSLRLDELMLEEESLREVRQALYHSGGAGYHVFRGFLAEPWVDHMRRFWGAFRGGPGDRCFESKQQFHAGGSDLFSVDARDNRIFFNFFWNAPVDEVTYTTSLWILFLRNRLSGRAPFDELLPHTGRAVSFRVTLTKNADTWIERHRDFFDHERRFEKGAYDLARLQATLFLAHRGRDYRDGGFTLETNDGKPVLFGRDVPIEPGDLVIWRYNNPHGVEAVRSDPDQLGFLRVIHPIETLVSSAGRSGLRSGLHSLRARLAAWRRS